jgi:hypothetical protein
LLILFKGPITGMILSPDGTMLATFCNIGCVRIWDVNDFQMLQKLIDTEVLKNKN